MDQPTGSPAPQDVQATFVATLADEWARGGVRAAVVCPGSRSTPLALALADHPGIAVHVHHDERSGGFLALGLALASGEPVVVLTTSGTATVELHPAVVEAHHAGVPLLVCTADRPPELQDVGAPQTVDQTRLYGTAVRWSADPGVPDLAARGRWRPLAARALAEAIGPPAGPVQLNLPFREPLVGTPAELPAPRPSPGPWAAGRSAGEPASGRPAAGPSTVGGSVGEPAPGLPSGGPWTVGRSATALPPGDPTVVVDVAGRLTGRGLIVAGAGPGPGVLDLAERLGWPVVADPRSGAWVDHPHVVAHLDAVLRSPAARERLRPEVVLRLGGVSSSRVVNEWLAGSGAHHVVVSGTGWTDPDGLAALVVRADPAAVVPALVASAPEGPVASPWLGAWQGAAAAAAGVVAERVDPRSEPGIARSLAAALPAGAQLVVSSSMPIRDVERYAAPRPGLRVLANRGANGIDGVVSTAVGAALAGPPTALLVGDVAFLHDSNGLLGLAGREVDLVVVVVDNDGGGIFSFLPQATKLPGDRFEALFGTPHGLDLVALAAAYGVEARAVGDDVGPAATEALAKGGAHVLVARTDRDANVEAHRVLDEAVAAAVTAALG